MYTDRNFKTKKALKDAVKAGEAVTFYQPNQMHSFTQKTDGTVYLEGPHYPNRRSTMAKKLTAKQRKWFEYMALKLELHHDNGTRFDLSKWISTEVYDDNGDWCVTKGCACGLATLDPTFTNAGFPKYLMWEDVTMFFHISFRQAKWLFSAESYKGETYGDKAAKKVARRIREFIASNGKVPKTFVSQL